MIALAGAPDATDERTRGGLTTAEARAALASHGRNEIARAQGPSAAAMFVRQFKGAMVWLLLAATVVSGALGEVADAIAIAVILVLNAVIGFFQEYRAERAVQALRSMTAPHARVLRDGRITDVPAAEVVVGDVLALEAGDVVAADARLVEANVLSTNEAALTGESVPVEKRVGADDAGGPLAERTGALFMGTAVATGTGRARVVATGMSTELGKIAHLLGEASEQATPLQQRLERVGRILLVACLGIVVAVAALGLLRGQPLLEVLLTAVSLAVAAVPEGLAAIVTIALAVGVQRMVSHNVLIRRLPAVETLGCATVVCTDKTGTLTTGVMTLREVWGTDRRQVLFAGAACCDAELDERGRGTGDPTEVALLAGARVAGIERDQIEQTHTRVSVHPFDADRKRMSILRRDAATSSNTLYVKGAVDLLLPLCRGGVEGALAANADMATRGLRVLGVAIGDHDEEDGLQLVGLVGLADPPRTEAVEAVAVARRAGIRTVMITGDHPTTAAAIAKEIGVLLPGEDPAEIVHARATPEDKLRIVRRWKERGAIVAMTGDGVNDAPALKEAHIGVAMGKAGTEVTREAADMILTDDNFASIVAAVKEGRGIYENIQKALVYLLAGNVGELLLMFSAAIFGLPLPLTPLMLLWINLVTDGLPALALVMDPTRDDVLDAPPRRADEPMLRRREWLRILAIGALTAATSLVVFFWALEERNVNEARNLAFSTLVFSQVFVAFAARSTSRVFFEVGVFTNLRLLLIVGVTVLLQLGLHHIPATQMLFDLQPLSLFDCGLSVGVSLVPVTLVEITKLASRWLPGRRQ